MVSRDPLEFPLVSTLLFGGVFVAATAYKFIKAIPARFVDTSHGKASDIGESPTIGLFFLAFALSSGCSVAVLRRFVLTRRALRHKNLATGGLVGLWYSVGCYFAFGRDMVADAGLYILHGAVFLATGYAVASGLNQVLRDPEKSILGD